MGESNSRKEPQGAQKYEDGLWGVGEANYVTHEIYGRIPSKLIAIR